MRTRTSSCVLAMVLTLSATYALAARRNATLTVTSSVTEDVTASSGGAWSAMNTITSPSSNPCPDGSNSTDDKGGLVTQCRWSNLSAGTTKVKGTTVRALLTTDSGEVFDVSIFCSRSSGSCPEPKAGTAYAAELNDDPKYLADYAKRREFGPMSVKFPIDGKKKVSYYIIFAMRAGSKQTHPD
jgi:hypothetical protein